jgi:hypothetical protein
MAGGKFHNTIKALLLFVAFSVLIITVAIDFGAEYGKNAEEIGGGALNLAEFQSTADTVEGNASAFRKSFEEGKVDDVDDASGIFSTAKKFINLITAPFKLLGILMTDLGVPKSIINIILGLLSIGLILGIWSVLRAGS